MANIKSALKRIKINKKKHDENKGKKSELKTYMKHLSAAIEDNRLDDAKKLLSVVDKKLKKAVANNVIHKNAASRRMSRFAKKMNAMR
ncbi:MAG: 30S ribosomal protein S20 [Tissierellia bacterium]|nr:30S ribosomal protein S20 [Tissierellia bacterium]